MCALALCIITTLILFHSKHYQVNIIVPEFYFHGENFVGTKSLELMDDRNNLQSRTEKKRKSS